MPCPGYFYWVIPRYILVSSLPGTQKTTMFRFYHTKRNSIAKGSIDYAFNTAHTGSVSGKLGSIQ